MLLKIKEHCLGRSPSESGSLPRPGSALNIQGIFSGRSASVCSFPRKPCFTPDQRTKKKLTFSQFFLCAPNRVRTCDLLLKRELLYQLSYGRLRDLRLQIFDLFIYNLEIMAKTAFGDKPLR
jgi:hypothetical protein